MRLTPAKLFPAMFVSGLLLGALLFITFRQTEPAPWSEAELALIRSLSLSQLPPLPDDPSNSVAADPRASALGSQLFFDTRLSRNGSFSCAACHQPQRRFTDGLPQARAIGRSRRNTPSIVGTAYSPWLYWDGRKDSLWSQALAPLEDPAEQGSNRMALVRLLGRDQDYRRQYELLFGSMPDFSDSGRFPENASPLGGESEWQQAWQQMSEPDRHLVNQVFANMGKVIAAYERTLMPAVSRFDRYADALQAGSTESEVAELLDSDERAGLRLFIGEARCMECHNGPLLTNHEFHNTGLLPAPGTLPDKGRSQVLEQLQSDIFNCLGPYSDAAPQQCLELRYMRKGPELIGAMRTPSLRNLGRTAPYMHKGQLSSLREVLEHYNEAPQALIGHNEATPLGLNSRQLRQLEAFLLTLDAPFVTRQQGRR